MKRTFTKYPSGYVKASEDVLDKWVVYYNEPLFQDRYDSNKDWSDYRRTPEGSSRYAVYEGKRVDVGTYNTEAEAERACRYGIDFTYPDGTPITIDLNYEQI